jgi:hypothetical protein
MNALLRLLALALLAAPLAARAGTDPVHGPHYPDVVSLERSFETASYLVLLPGAENGTITVNNCGGCVATTLSVNAKTRWVLGTQETTLAQFRSRLAGAPHTNMTVFADLKEPVAIRVVAHVLTPPTPARTR